MEHFLIGTLKFVVKAKLQFSLHVGRCRMSLSLYSIVSASNN